MGLLDLQATVHASQKNHPLRLRFSDIFSFSQIHLLYVPIYAKLQIFIQLSQILTKTTLPCYFNRY